jgi:hypothetical protein
MLNGIHAISADIFANSLIFETAIRQNGRIGASQNMIGAGKGKGMALSRQEPSAGNITNTANAIPPKKPDFTKHPFFRTFMSAEENNPQRLLSGNAQHGKPEFSPRVKADPHPDQNPLKKMSRADRYRLDHAMEQVGQQTLKRYMPVPPEEKLAIPRQEKSNASHHSKPA